MKPRCVHWNRRSQLVRLAVRRREFVRLLLDFKASQMADSIRSALDAQCIDIGVCGDWDEIKAELG